MAARMSLAGLASIVLLALLLAPIAAFLAKAQQEPGLVLALETSIENARRLLERLGVPSDSPLWQRLSSIEEQVATVEQLLNEGKKSDAARFAGELFREIGSIVREAVREYSQAPATLAIEVRRLLAEERLLLRVLASIAARAERLGNLTLAAVNTTNVAACMPGPGEAEEIAGKAEELRLRVENLYNQTLGLLVRDVSNETLAMIRSQLAGLRNETRSLAKELNQLWTRALACDVAAKLGKKIEILEERLKQLEQRAEELRSRGLDKAVQALEKRIEVLRERLERLMAAVNATLAGEAGQDDLALVLRGRWMLPSLDAKINAARQKLSHAMMVHDLSLLARLLDRLSNAFEKAAERPAVPSTVRENIRNTASMLANLSDALKSYMAGEGGLDSLLGAVNATRAALEQVRNNLAGLGPAANIVEKLLDRVERLLNRVEKEARAAPAMTARGSLAAADHILVAALRIARLAGEEEMANTLAVLRELVNSARNALAAGDDSAALSYVDEALQKLTEIKRILASENGWISDRLEILLDQAEALLEQAQQSLAPATA